MPSPVTRTAISVATSFAMAASFSTLWPSSMAWATCQVRARAASISAAMSAILNRIAWNEAIGCSNWTRSRLYATESSSAPRANPIARAAVWTRATLRPDCVAAKAERSPPPPPSPPRPRRLASGTRRPSNHRWKVVIPW